MGEIPLQKISLAEFESHCDGIAKKIRDSGFVPEIIIGIARGGLVPSVYLSDALGVPHIAAVQIRLYTDRGVKGRLEILDYTRRDLAGKKVLVVDDVSDSGETLLALEGWLRGHKVGEYKIACIHSKPGTKRVPDFYAEETHAWLQYPWNKREEGLGE